MKVSILIPAHNAANFVGYAIASALSQTHQDIEVIVVDDGSTDSTSDIVHDLQKYDSRIFLIRNANPLGPAGARNVALAHATGAWIALLDSDDEFVPDRLETLLDIAEARGLDAVADGLELMAFETRTSLGPAFDPAWLKEERPISLSYLLERDWPGRTRYRAFGLMKPIIRKSFIDFYGLQYAEQFNLSEDLLFYCDLIISGARFGVADKLMYKYYIRKGSVSNKPNITTQLVDVNIEVRRKLKDALHANKNLKNDLRITEEREKALWLQIFTWSIKIGNTKFAARASRHMSMGYLVKNILEKVWKKSVHRFFRRTV
jgi:glycosyltransferase involved in cell wall biosynthesis